MSNQIGIIGGADGPTAIYISSNISPAGWLALAAVLVAAGVLLLWRHNKKKK